MFPEPDSVRGKVAIDAAFHEFYEPMTEPMMLTIDGKIQQVDGGGASRTVMDRSLKRAGGGDYGYVIHFTYAIHPVRALHRQIVRRGLARYGQQRGWLGHPLLGAGRRRKPPRRCDDAAVDLDRWRQNRRRTALSSAPPISLKPRKPCSPSTTNSFKYAPYPFSRVGEGYCGAHDLLPPVRIAKPPGDCSSATENGRPRSGAAAKPGRACASARSSAACVIA